MDAAVSQRPLPAFEDHAPADRFCDLVLTGGVTSAIAYPALILTLASRLRFHSIGGASSGAGAAALAAAAEYRRRHGSAEGFHRLLERTAEVRLPATGGTTRLRWLFQPWPESRRLFEAVAPALTRPTLDAGVLLRGMWHAYVRGLRRARLGLRAAQVLVPLGVALVLVGLAMWGGAVWADSPESTHRWVLAGLSAEMLGLAAGGFGVLAALMGLGAAAAALLGDMRRVVDDDFGLCGGLEGVAPDSPAPLTAWLHGVIQEVAGRGPADAPLTFADLRDAPASPRAMGQGNQAMDGVSIRLQMYAANLTLGQPLVLPLRERDEPLYFMPSEMRRLFPDAVVDHMKQRRYEGTLPLAPRRPVRRRQPAPPGQADEDALWELPRKGLPIIVAARMSASAPLLFAAVPVWVAHRQAGGAVMRRCLLSDGGLCSNFPIHMFDCAIPSWPTFGVALYDAPGEPGRPREAVGGLTPQEVARAVTLPERHDAPPAQNLNRFDEEPSRLKRTLGFVGGLLWTARDWNDTLLSSLPGVRDRIARIELPPGIGGLNIDMRPAQIQALSDLGQEAGRRLLERFARPSAPDGVAAGWREHRWVRFQLLRQALASLLAGAGTGAARGRYAAAMQQQIRDATQRPPLATDAAQCLPAAQAAVLEGALAAVLAAERALDVPDAALPFTPWPQPVLRLRPPL